MQADLGPTPQDVVGTACPLVRDQIIDLGSRQSGAVMLAEIQHAPCLAENLFDACAIRTRQSMSSRGGQETPAFLHAGEERRKVRSRQVAAGQRRFVSP